MDPRQKFLLSSSALEQQIFSVPKSRGKGALTFLNVNFLPHLIRLIKDKHLSQEEVASLNNYHLQTYLMEKSTLKFKYSSLKQLVDILLFDLMSMEEFWLPHSKKREEILLKRDWAEKQESRISEENDFSEEGANNSGESKQKTKKASETQSENESPKKDLFQTNDVMQKDEFYSKRNVLVLENEGSSILEEKSGNGPNEPKMLNTFAVIAEESKLAFSCYAEYEAKCKSTNFLGIERLTPMEMENSFEDSKEKRDAQEKDGKSEMEEENKGNSAMDKLRENLSSPEEKMVENKSEEEENSSASESWKSEKESQFRMKNKNGKATAQQGSPRLSKENHLEKWVSPAPDANFQESRREIIKLHQKIKIGQSDLSQLNSCTESSEFRERIMTRKQEGARDSFAETKWLELTFAIPEHLSRCYKVDLSFFIRIDYARSIGINLRAFKMFKVSQWLPSTIFKFFTEVEPWRSLVSSAKDPEVTKHLFQNFLLYICSAPGVVSASKSKNFKKMKGTKEEEEEALQKIEKDFFSVISKEFCLFCARDLEINIRNSLSLKKTKRLSQIKFIQNALLASRSYLLQTIKGPKKYYGIRKTKGIKEKAQEESAHSSPVLATRTRVLNGAGNPNNSGIHGTNIHEESQKMKQALPKLARSLFLLSKLESSSVNQENIPQIVCAYRHFYDSVFMKSDTCKKQFSVMKRLQSELKELENNPNNALFPPSGPRSLNGSLTALRDQLQKKSSMISVEKRKKDLMEACSAFKADLERINGETGSLTRKVTDFSMWTEKSLKRFLEGLLKYFSVFINNKKITEFIGQPHHVLRTHDVKRLKNKYLRFARKRWVKETGDNGVSGVIQILKRDIENFQKEEAFPWIFGKEAPNQEELVQDEASSSEEKQKLFYF